MKRVILSCPTLRGELEPLLKTCTTDTTCIYLPSSLHSSPSRLREYLQEQIDSQPEDVDQILLCVSQCGGGTTGLTASTTPLVIPKTRDCIDILLSGESLSTLERDAHGIFLTKSWMESFQNSALDLNTMTQKYGKERAEERLRQIYRGFTNFYVIDTGSYDLAPVIAYIQPLVTLLDGKLELLPGKCGILRKLVAGKLDWDFQIIPKHSTSPKGEHILKS